MIAPGAGTICPWAKSPNTCPWVVLKLWVEFTNGCDGNPGKVKVVIVELKFGLAVLEAAFGAAVREVLIRLAGVTLLTPVIRLGI